MTREMPYFKFYPQDFLYGTQAMTRREVGDYTRLLMMMYDDGGSVPFNPQRLKRLLGCYHATACEKRIRRLIDLGKIIIDEQGNLHNARVDGEIQTFKEFRKIRTEMEPDLSEKPIDFFARVRSQNSKSLFDSVPYVQKKKKIPNGNGRAASGASPGCEGRYAPPHSNAKATGPPRSEIEAQLMRQLAQRGSDFAQIVADISLETYNAAVDAEMTEAGAGLALILERTTT
jgi:uncharacterized protein YdaU (DUF1376 family)